MKNILYITSQYPTLTETFIAREMQELVNQGNNVTIAVIRHKKSSLGHAGIIVDSAQVIRHPLSFSNILLNTAYAFFTAPTAYVRCMAELIQDCICRPKYSLASIYMFLSVCWLYKNTRYKGFDWIRAHFLHTEAIVAHWLSIFLDIPYAITAHVVNLYHSTELLRQVVANASFTIGISNQSVKLLYELGAEHPLLIRNGVDLEQFHYRISEEGLNEPPLILAIGSLLPMKGFDVLLRALSTLQKEGPPFECSIIGEGHERNNLELLIQNLSLSHVYLAGPLPFSKVTYYLARATILVMPSQSSKQGIDGIPTVLIEAMASGVPVVSTCFAGIPDLVINEYSGLLAEPGDENDLARKIKWLLEDSRLRDRLRENAIRMIRSDYDMKKNGVTISMFMDSYPSKEKT